MFRKAALNLIVLFGTLSIASSFHVVIDTKLRKFIGTLERYANTPNDVVFLLDESGSIGAERFLEVLGFTKLTVGRFTVMEEMSRISVVTFATDTINHIDYIDDPKDHNMCTLLKEIDEIGYVGEWTHTSKAMKAAEKILQNSRPNANKIIVLLSDGESNDGYSPLAISKELKEKGIIIFAVGVADVNTHEIYGVATSPEHVYILEDFEYIKKVNLYLVNDTKEVWMDLTSGTSLCNSFCDEGVDCCDEHANCYCGTRSGLYECACIAGYYGKGHRGECHKCPRGTYKSEARNANCVTCPEYSTTEREGSTSLNDCECEDGFEKIGDFCTAVKCASLSVPEGGILVPSHCNNTYGTKCSFKCRVGYCPFSCQGNNYLPHVSKQHAKIPSRVCLKNREWSGEAFYCEKVTCPALQFPFDGKHNCSDTDFVYGSTCHFECHKGYNLHGSSSRRCLVNGSWTGKETRCKKIRCAPLKTNSQLYVKQKDCGLKYMKYRSVCQYYCTKGYTLVSDKNSNESAGVMTCEANKKWSGSRVSCQDIEPPKIFCPKSIEVTAETHKNYASVLWQYPRAEDNVFMKDVTLIEPTYIKEPSYNFTIGTTKLSFRATDVSLLTTECSYTVKVLDKEPPKVVYCPENVEVYHDNNDRIQVFWENPVFEDNSKGNLTVTHNRENGGEFSWGPESHIYYNATDKAGNKATCTFTVKVKHYACPYYAPPANGVLTCDTWADGRLCSIFCHDGFIFASTRDTSKTYFCKQANQGGNVKGIWQPIHGDELKMPWPDCSKKQKPSMINIGVGVSYSVDSCSQEILDKMSAKFVQELKDLTADLFCPKQCIPENVNVACSAVKSQVKRSLHDNPYSAYSPKSNRLNRETPKHILTISFNMEMFSNATDLNSETDISNELANGNKIDVSSLSIMKEIENKISQNVKDAYHLISTPEPKAHYDVIAMCTTGQIKVNNTCVNCPSGTYKEDVSGTCMECPIATYQDEERRLSCKACPAGFTTYQVKSKSKDDCKAPCQPGTFSKTTFEPCLACPFNTYQERAGRKDCMKCPPELFTWKVGSVSFKDCVAPCKPGSYSATGFEPCDLCDIQSYQNEEKQTNCHQCPYRQSATVKGSKSIDDCNEIDVCKAQPCAEASTCIQLDKEYECLCPEGLLGEHCEINLDDCASNPCINNGTCVDEIGNFTCICSEGWTGQHCEININDCISNPCLNEGECIDMLNSYTCQCKPGYEGIRCEINIYECASNPCMNNGTCFDKENGYRCCCNKGYFGDHCEKEEDFCDVVTCENGGSCTSTLEDFNCTCASGFEGKFCENNIDDCIKIQCQNGGVCLDGIGNATCICPLKYYGRYCEEALKPQFMITFPNASISNYVELKNNHLLYAITVSFFMRTRSKDFNSRATPISYSYQNKDGIVDNALTLMDTNNFVLFIHGEIFHTEYTANKDALWHHYAVTWQKKEGKWSLYVDGKSTADGLHVGENKYMHPGVFILGQEQDRLGDGFSTLEAFEGDITEFNVWDYALTTEEIQRISISCGFIGNIIPWYLASRHTHGSVIISSQVDKCTDIGQCSEISCDCFYSNKSEAHSCKHEVQQCDEDTCANSQSCITSEGHSFCDCISSFEGRSCEYDVNECLENNGGCEYTCINDVGSYHCECPEDMIVSSDRKSCAETSFCVMDGAIYSDGESWINSCRDCVCDHGHVRCEEKICSETFCHEEETLITPPGECCARCVAWSFCIISLNNTVNTFDTSRYQIEGKCTYTAVEDCYGGHFKVQIDQVTPSGINLIIHEDCFKVIMSYDGNILIDNDTIDLPFKNEKVFLQQDNSTVSIWTQSNLHIQWNFTNEIIIAIPITDVNKVCGLCKKVEESLTSNLGKYKFPERTATGENECFAVYEDFRIASGGFNIHFSSSILTILCSFLILSLIANTRILYEA